VIALFVAIAILAWPYIDLAVDLDIAGRHLDTPVADLAGAVLFAVIALDALAEPPRLTRPSLAGYAAFVALALVAVPFVPDRGASAWYLLRKPVFFYVAYGVVLATVVRDRGAPVRPLLLAAVTLASTITLVSSAGRILAGNTLWWSAIEGLTNNHKTLAVAIAPTLPLILGMRRSRLDLVVVGLALVALLASVSRTAWITAAVGLAFFVVWQGRTIASRRGVVLGVIALGAALAVYTPVLMRSHAQMDAARSRHSLDKRAWEMVESRPALGWGGGASTRYEMTLWPHYRINGVDAHGAVQKVGAEFGLLGLGAWLAFVVGMGARLRSRAALLPPMRDVLAPAHLHLGIWATFVALHANLLFSTETFSQTHWIPLGLLWGLSERRR
jgi:hypothetical protein